jgi:adenine-specific DNA-methyltransferase
MARKNAANAPAIPSVGTDSTPSQTSPPKKKVRDAAAAVCKDRVTAERAAPRAPKSSATADGARGATRPTQRPSPVVDTRVVYCGDNLEQLRKLPEACVDLIYIDPPFNSNRNYEVFWGETKEKRAFEDRHASTQAYIDFMRPRCVELARVLKKTGSFYYHCDWHASHYVKVMLDQIFGENNFQNEIAWKRSSAHSDSKRYGANHDTIFFYTGGASEWVWNKQFTPYDEAYVEQNYRYNDEKGRFRVSDMTANKPGGDVSYEWTTPDGKVVKPYKGRYWAYSKEKMKRMEDAGEIYYRTTGMPMLKHYLDEMPGVPLQTMWDDIKPVISGSEERLGYPTQKPLALLERILKSSSNENDIVLDAFCGCGTALVAAQKLKRQWIGIDISPTACRVMAKRLRDVCGLPEDKELWKIGRGFVVRDLPWTEEKLRAIPPFEFENWAVIALGGIPNKAQVGDMGIDGRIFPVGSEPKAFGEDELQLRERWYPIQVKQKDRVGRPEIDAFETALRRSRQQKGFFSPSITPRTPCTRSTASSKRNTPSSSRSPCARFWMSKLRGSWFELSAFDSVNFAWNSCPEHARPDCLHSTTTRFARECGCRWSAYKCKWTAEVPR